MSIPCPQMPSRPGWWHQQRARRRDLPECLRCLLSSVVAWPVPSLLLLPCRGSAFPSLWMEMLSAGALRFGHPRVAFLHSSGLIAGPCIPHHLPKPVGITSAEHRGAIHCDEFNQDDTGWPLWGYSWSVIPACGMWGAAHHPLCTWGGNRGPVGTISSILVCGC